MSDLAIRVEGLSKLYHIGARQARYRTLRETLTDFAVAPFRRAAAVLGGRSSQAAEEDLWALKNVAFDIKRGEVVGVIGRNGAGKSTLLKILSRITDPTEGRVGVKGRIGSLLEVGTGFHPELTGRENIYLNGAILGMRRAEIERKFDEIVAFAEIEKFLDTPVKHYSSGMYMRLAFAVAAHLEPEVLLVDEVLAVGDAAFQKKCLGKMGDVAKQGRTVLFVSHQLNQIRRLCGRALWIADGQLKRLGTAQEVVSAYESDQLNAGKDIVARTEMAHGSAKFSKWEIIDSEQEQPNQLTSFGPVMVRFMVQVNKEINNAHLGIALFDLENRLMWAASVDPLNLKAGLRELVFTLSTLPVAPGSYHWSLSLYNENGLADQWEALPALIVATVPTGHASDQWQGVLNLPWEFRAQ